MRNRENRHNQKNGFDGWAKENRPLKRESIFYSTIETYPDEKLEYYLLFEIDFRTNRAGKNIFIEKDMKKRHELHLGNLKHFLQMIDVVRCYPQITVNIKQTDDDILKLLSEARLFYSRSVALNVRFNQAVNFLMRHGRNGDKKTRQEKAADFFFIWDCLERMFEKDGETHRLKDEYIKSELNMHPKTYQNYRDSIKDWFSLETENSDMRLLRAMTS